jgi:hypothetical protein
MKLMEAIHPHHHSGAMRKPGDRYEVEDVHVAVLVHGGFARPVPADALVVKKKIRKINGKQR